MSLGMAERQGDLLDDLSRFCEQALAESSVYALLNRERDRLFPDEMFADLVAEGIGAEGAGVLMGAHRHTVSSSSRAGQDRRRAVDNRRRWPGPLGPRVGIG